MSAEPFDKRTTLVEARPSTGSGRNGLMIVR
jgi:hypothetical protein